VKPAWVVHAQVSAQRSGGDIADLGEVERRGGGLLVAPIPGKDPIPAVAIRCDEREAVLDGDDALGRLGEADVGKKPRFDHGMARKRQCESFADRAVQAVGADRITRPEVSTPSATDASMSTASASWGTSITSAP